MIPIQNKCNFTSLVNRQFVSKNEKKIFLTSIIFEKFYSKSAFQKYQQLKLVLSWHFFKFFLFVHFLIFCEADKIFDF